MNVNNVVLTGRVGSEPEIKTVGKGKNSVTIAQFSIANDRGWGDREKTNWFRCTAFGTTAEKYIAKYTHKGDLVGIQGELSYSTWSDKGGNTRSSIEILVREIETLASASRKTIKEDKEEALEEYAMMDESAFGDDFPQF